MDKPEENLTLLGEPVVDPVLNVTGSSRQVSLGVVPQLREDPLNGFLSVLGSDVRVNALVTEIVDIWPQVRLRLGHVIEGGRYLS